MASVCGRERRTASLLHHTPASPALNQEMQAAKSAALVHAQLLERSEEETPAVTMLTTTPNDALAHAELVHAHVPPRAVPRASACSRLIGPCIRGAIRGARRGTLPPVLPWPAFLKAPVGMANAGPDQPGGGGVPREEVEATPLACHRLIARDCIDCSVDADIHGRPDKLAFLQQASQACCLVP